MTDNNFLIVSYWRSGSNLLAMEINKSLDGVYLDDIFQQLKIRGILLNLVNANSINHNDLLEIEKVLRTNINRYLHKLTDPNYNNHGVIAKLMYADFMPGLARDDDTVSISKSILARFGHKIFLYRRNIFEMLVSFLIASATQKWASREKKSVNDVFEITINREEFSEWCESFVRYFYCVKNFDCEYSLALEYESDLVPYFRDKDTILHKLASSEIKNIADLREIYDSTVLPHEENIFNYYAMLKQKNKISPSEYLNTILQERKY